MAPRALEALIFETKTSFPIDRKQLIAMDDAGVADEVIDVMVAFSFPRKFKVRRSAGASSWGGFDSGGLGGRRGGARRRVAVVPDPDYSYVAFPYWSFGGGYYYPGGAVEVGGGDGTITPAEPHGRVVNGLGYTQVLRARDAGGQPTPRVRSGGDGAATSGSDSGSSSGGTSSATSGGYSSGGGGGDAGRTAVPR